MLAKNTRQLHRASKTQRARAEIRSPGQIEAPPTLRPTPARYRTWDTHGRISASWYSLYETRHRVDERPVPIDGDFIDIIVGSRVVPGLPNGDVWVRLGEWVTGISMRATD